MPHADFVHLHVHSAYSLSEGAIRIADLIGACQRMAMPAVAITDTGNLFGALEFSTACAAAGIQPIIGTEIAVRCHEPQAGALRAPEPDRIVLLAQNEAGYGNLLKLSSKAFLETSGGETPHVDLVDLDTHGSGLIALSGGPGGPIDRALRDGQHAVAADLAARLAGAFPRRFYIEVQRYGEAGTAKVENDLLALAYERDLPVVATNQAYFLEAETYEAHDALLCVADGTYVSESNRRRLTPEHRLKGPDEMRALFHDLPEALDNTVVIAERCAVAAPARDPILPPYAVADGRTAADELRGEAAAGLKRRLADQIFAPDMDEVARAEAAQPYRERLAYEIDVIVSMDYAGYFLIVADFVRWAREHGIPVGPGRGSGAGSVAAWSLAITDLDPLRFGLLFERFLNPERVSMPDFDIDFCQDRRDEVLRYVVEKYGNDRVAQIITFGTLQARAVLRDVGRVLQMPYGLIDRICKMVPNVPANPVKLGDAIAAEPRLRHLRETEDGVAKLIDISLKLEGLYRHASTHAAGVVIADRPLDELIPLYRDPRSDMPVTQFAMKYAEMSGLVKFDFLGLKTLTVIDRACRMLAERGVDVDIDHLPLDDAVTYAMLRRADTMGVFQFESAGMRDLLRDSEPSNFEDLIALVALFRPGPMENIPKYIACKHGREKPEFLHETIEPVVKDTYGVVIYQEQVMQIAQVFAGFSLGQADLLRRAMGKKNDAEFEARRGDFVEGAVARGIDRSRAVQVFELVRKFAGYGFNKAHSAGYALVAYQTAWLKANHPNEFLAASMSLDLTNTDKLGLFRQELNRMEVPLLVPDINRSGAIFTVDYEDEGRPVCYALAAIKNVGRAAAEAMVAEREHRGPYASLMDFAQRIDAGYVNKRQLENLAAAGAFDSLNGNRAAVSAGVETILAFASAAAQERDSQQSNLFGDSGADTQTDIQLPKVEPWQDTEKMEHEFDAIGFHLSGHPVESYAASFERLGIALAAELPVLLNGSARKLKLAGSVHHVRERTSARGNRYASVQLSDPSGPFEVVVFSEQLASSRELLEAGALLLLGVEGRMEEGQTRLAVQSVVQLEAAAASASPGLEISIADAQDGEGALQAVKRGLDRVKRGSGRVSVRLHLEVQHRDVEIELPGGFAISSQVRDAIGQIPGVSRVREL